MGGALHMDHRVMGGIRVDVGEILYHYEYAPWGQQLPLLSCLMYPQIPKLHTHMADVWYFLLNEWMNKRCHPSWVWDRWHKGQCRCSPTSYLFYFILSYLSYFILFYFGYACSMWKFPGQSIYFIISFYFILFYFILAVLVAWGNSQAREQTYAAATTQASTVTMPDP